MATLETKQSDGIKLESTGFQSPDMAVQNLKERLDRYINKLRQQACANAVITKVDPSYDMDSKSVHPGDVVFDEKHCKNQRRNGSKYCQQCSDDHNGITPRENTDGGKAKGTEVGPETKS